jgi:hypothetical protein
MADTVVTSSSRTIFTNLLIYFTLNLVRFSYRFSYNDKMKQTIDISKKPMYQDHVLNKNLISWCHDTPPVSIMTLGIIGLLVTFNINDTWHNNTLPLC